MLRLISLTSVVPAFVPSLDHNSLLMKKFYQPYKPLLDLGVKFYASLGNHDNPQNKQYPPWNMGGEMYYTYATKNVRFFALDSNQDTPRKLGQNRRLA